MDPFVLGEYTWNGYTCTSLGYPYTMLEAKQDGCVFQVMILTKNGEYEIYTALNTRSIINEEKISLCGVAFEKELTPVKLEKKEVPAKYTLDTPAGILFENDLFKQYVKDNNLPIDVVDFEKRLFWIDSKALRVTICDGDVNITYEQMEDLVDYLNKNSQIDRSINFDEIVKKYRPW